MFLVCFVLNNGELVPGLCLWMRPGYLCVMNDFSPRVSLCSASLFVQEQCLLSHKDTAPFMLSQLIISCPIFYVSVSPKISCFLCPFQNSRFCSIEKNHTYFWGTFQIILDVFLNLSSNLRRSEDCVVWQLWFQSQKFFSL